jgi:hypothetical protein
MRLYIEANSWEIWSQPTRSPILRLDFQRGATQPLLVRFVQDATVVPLASASATGTLSFFADPSSSNLLVPAVTWSKTGMGPTTTYTFTPIFTGTNLDTALGSDVSISAYMQIKWTDGSTAGKTPLLSVRIFNSHA